MDESPYYYDPEAAELPIKFIEKYCRHWQGDLVGHPFLLHEAQKKIIRDIYGTKRRADGLRRYNRVLWLGAIGSGKSPLAGLLLLFHLLCGPPGQELYSYAASFQQSMKAVFEYVKNIIKMEPELAERLRCTQYEISYPASNSVWRIISGTKAKSGGRPSVVLSDELNDQQGKEIHDALLNRMGKVEEPLWIGLCNAPKTRNTLAAQLIEEAELAAEGKGDQRLYPVLWRADNGCRIDDPAAWKQANKLLGVTIKEEAVRELALAALGNSEKEAEFRRGYLSQIARDAKERWIDLTEWDSCTGDIDPAAVKGLPLWVGFDIGLVDDLSAVCFVWAGPERFYVRSHFWLPRRTAEQYDLQNSIPYPKWAPEHITLVDSPTISDKVHREIAAYILDKSKGYDLKAICYDRYKADVIISELEKSKPKPACVAVPQGYTTTPGCACLEKGILERSVMIEANPVLRLCAENACLQFDSRANFWVCKPNAKEKFAGTRSLKVDGISALVTALVEARKVSFNTAKDKPALRAWIV